MNTLWTEQQIKVHRLINNSQVLQKVMVKDFPVKYYSMRCFTFWEDINTILNSQYWEQLIIINTCCDPGKRVRKHRWVFPVFFPRLWWPIELKFSQVCVQVVIQELWVFGQYCFIVDVLLLKREPPASSALHYFSNWYENCWVLLVFFFGFFWGGRSLTSFDNCVKCYYVWYPSTSFMFHSLQLFSRPCWHHWSCGERRYAVRKRHSF